MARLIGCDVHLHFSNGQPSYTCYVGEVDKPRDEAHAISLAKMNAGAKGWDMRFCDEAHTTGLTFSRK